MQFTLIEHSAGGSWLEPPLHQVVGCGEPLGKACYMRSLARQAETVLAKKERNGVREILGALCKQREGLWAVGQVAKVT